MLIGVDEAGRGPVLGSMFVAAVRVSDQSILPDGIRDSKALTPAVREDLAREIRSVADHITVIEIEASRIDAHPGGLNRLTIEGSGEAAKSVQGETPVRVIADACDVNEKRYEERLAAQLPDAAAVTAMHGADAKEPIVGAASIIAKSEREAHVEELKRQYGDLGSGYPSDPTTRSFLEAFLDTHGELPACARRSWGTCRDLLEAAEQGTLAEF